MSDMAIRWYSLVALSYLLWFGCGAAVLVDSICVNVLYNTRGDFRLWVHAITSLYVAFPAFAGLSKTLITTRLPVFAYCVILSASHLRLLYIFKFQRPGCSSFGLWTISIGSLLLLCVAAALAKRE